MRAEQRMMGWGENFRGTLKELVFLVLLEPIFGGPLPGFADNVIIAPAGLWLFIC